jgi:hypothetical protein
MGDTEQKIASGVKPQCQRLHFLMHDNVILYISYKIIIGSGEAKLKKYLRAVLECNTTF